MRTTRLTIDHEDGIDLIHKLGDIRQALFTEKPLPEGVTKKTSLKFLVRDIEEAYYDMCDVMEDPPYLVYYPASQYLEIVAYKEDLDGEEQAHVFVDLDELRSGTYVVTEWENKATLD